MKLHRTIAGALVAFTFATGALAADGAPTWQTRYEAAKVDVAHGDCIRALPVLAELERNAPSADDRVRAHEVSDVCRAILEGERDPKRRTTEEMMLLYTSAFAYGVGTSAWFVLETEPNNVLAAMLPFGGFTLASVGAVALVDRWVGFPRGVPQSIASGLYLGLGEGIWVLALQHARASRIRNATGYDPRWSTATDAAALWSMATIGAVTSTLVGYARLPTPGRVSFTASAMIWGGLLAAGVSGAILPYGDRRAENVFLVGGIGYNTGLIGGLLAGPRLAPSVARMRFVDLGGAGGGLLALGLYALATQSDADARAALGIASAGAASGLALTWLATQGMAKDDGSTSTASTSAHWLPIVAPVEGGAQVGVGGVF